MTESSDEFLAQLNDPQKLQEAAAKLGYTLAKTDTGTGKADEIKTPVINLDPTAELSELIGGINSALQQIVEYQDKKFEHFTGKQEQTKQEQTATMVKDFGVSHKHFKDPEVLKIVDALWRVSSGRPEDLEEAYKTALKARGLEEEQEPEPVEDPLKISVPVASVKSDDEPAIGVPAAELERKTPVSTKEIISQGLDDIIADKGELEVLGPR